VQKGKISHGRQLRGQQIPTELFARWIQFGAKIQQLSQATNARAAFLYVQKATYKIEFVQDQENAQLQI